MMKRGPVFLVSLWVLSAGIFFLSTPACAEVKVFFENNTAGPVKLATIPPDGKKAKLVATIKPQEVYPSQADAGSRWAIYDANNKPLKAITLTAEPLQHYTADTAGKERESKSGPDKTLTKGAQAPLAAIAFLNNSPGDVKIATFQPGDKKSKLVEKVPPRQAFRTEAPVGSRWIIFDMDNNVLNSTEVTREAEQYLMAVPPANPDKTTGTADDQSRREESARQQEASAEQAEETAFITGMYLTEGGFFLQEPDASGKLSDTWSYRHHGTPDIIQKNYTEVERGPDGVVISLPAEGKSYLLSHVHVKIKAPDGRSWREGPGGRWMDKEEGMQMLTGQAEQKKNPGRQLSEAERERMNAREEILQIADAIAAEDAAEEVDEDPDFEVTKAFECGSGIFVNTRPQKWEFWPDDFSTDVTFEEVARDGNGVTLVRDIDGSAARLKEDHFLWRTPQGGGFQVVDSDDAMGEWVYDSVKDLRAERAESRKERDLQLAKEAEQWGGADPQVVKILMADPNYQRWLKTDQEGAVRTKRVTEETDEDPFKAIEYLQQGYNILNMNPGRPSRNGLGASNMKLIDLDVDFQPFYKNTSIQKRLPLALTSKRRGDLKKIESSDIYFNGYERSQSESFNVSVGAEVGGKGKGGSAEVGYGNTKERMNSKNINNTYIYSEVRAYYCDLFLDKQHLRLHDDLRNRIMAHVNGERPLNTAADFEKFFKEFGTHYALRAMIGGKAWEETTINAETVAERISESTSVSGGVSFPIKAVQLSVKASHETSETTQNTSGQSRSRIELNAFGGTMMGDIDEWELDTDNTQDMEPLRVMLRPVWDLLRGPLFPLQTVQQAQAIEALRERMQVELEAYIRRETADFQPPPTAKPYMLKAMVDYFSCTKADDFEVFANAKPEIYGYIKLWHNGNLVATPLDIPESSPEEMDTKGVLMTNQSDKQASVILIPEYYKDGSGRWQVRYPETKMKVTWKITEDDTSGDTLVSSSYYEYTRSRYSGYEAGSHTELKDFGKSGAGSYQISVSFVPELLNPVSEKSAHQHPDWNDF